MAEDLRIAARVPDYLKRRLRLEAAIRGLSVNRTVAALLDEQMRSPEQLAALIAAGEEVPSDQH